MAEAKSKRDLIWEQKKKMREQQQRGQNAGQDAPDNAQPVNFAKKSLFSDNSAPEPILQNTRPLENQDFNRGRNFSQQPEEPVNQRNENPSPFQDRREPPFKMQDTAASNQPAYSEYEPPVNRNNNRQHARMADELQEARKPVNFNPSFEPTGGEQAYEPAVRDSREMNDARRRKADYGEDLRTQMRQKEMQKQQEKNEVRNSVQGISGNDNFYRENDRKQKGDYGDYLKQQMREKQEAKNQESGRVRNPEPQQQEYFPFGKPGAGAPNREAMNAFNNPPPMNYPPQQNQQYPPPRQQQQQQQQYYPPQGPGNFQQYPNQAPSSREFSRQQQQQQQQGGYPPQQQAYDYNRQQSDNYQAQRPPPQQQQQPYYNAPPSGQDGASMYADRNAPRQEFARQETYGSYDQLPREEPELPTNLNPEANNYRRGNTMERERAGYRGQPLSSEDPQMLARKEKMKQDFQKGLQEQIEFKKRQKEMEQKKKREEERLEEERLKREQEELARRQALEDNKKKPQAQNAPPQEPNQFVQEPKNRRNREKPPVQAYDAQNNFDQNGPPPRGGDPYGGYPGQPPYNQQQQQQPPYNPQYQQQQNPYNPQYNPQYAPPHQQQGYPPGPGPQQQFYPPGQMYPQMMRNEVTSELQNIRSEIQNQQNVLSKQLDSIKKEAMNAMEERNRAEKELTNLREQLKQKIISEDLYKKNLREALERNAQPRIQQNPEGPTRITYKEPPVGYDPYPIQEKPPRHRPPPSNSYGGYPDTESFEKQAYNIRQTNQNLLDNYQNMQMQESRTPFLDNDRTLAGDTKLIPLAVFDNRGSLEGMNVRRGGNDPLTLSKIQNYGMGRPSSSKQQPQWHKEDDSIDALLKAHGALRPGSSESNAFGDTSRMIGRHLDDASAIMKQGDISGTGKIVNRYNLKSREGTDTLSLAARNILADKSSNIGANPYGQPERRLMSRGEEGIKFNNTADILPDLSIGGHGGTHNYELAEGPSMNTTGMSFNIDRINMANEARLNKLNKFGSGHSRTDMHYDPGRGKGNYYGNNRGELEAIEESADMDENLAKIDKILGSYLKTHEEEGIHKRDLMM